MLFTFFFNCSFLIQFLIYTANIKVGGANAGMEGAVGGANVGAEGSVGGASAGAEGALDGASAGAEADTQCTGN